MNLSLYVLRNSGFRVWLAQMLVMAAGRLNPERPWARNAVTRPRMPEPMRYSRDGSILAGVVRGPDGPGGEIVE